MEPLVLLPLAALHAALVGLLQLPVGVVVNAFPCFSFPMAWAWSKIQIPNMFKQNQKQILGDASPRGFALGDAYICLPWSKAAHQCELQYGMEGYSPFFGGEQRGQVCLGSPEELMVKSRAQLRTSQVSSGQCFSHRTLTGGCTRQGNPETMLRKGSLLGCYLLGCHTADLPSLSTPILGNTTKK